MQAFDEQAHLFSETIDVVVVFSSAKAAISKELQVFNVYNQNVPWITKTMDYQQKRFTRFRKAFEPAPAFCVSANQTLIQASVLFSNRSIGEKKRVQSSAYPFVNHFLIAPGLASFPSPLGLCVSKSTLKTQKW